MNNYTYEQKVEMYKAGTYKFEVPPVCTVPWDVDSWIRFIDACDGWPKLEPI